MRRILRLLLGVGAAAGMVTALALEAHVTPAARGAAVVRLGTPVLSARRLPSVLEAVVAERRLGADLDAWRATSPPDTCVVVRDDAGDIDYAFRADEPMVPASTLKLFTAAAVLQRLGVHATLRTSVVASRLLTDGVLSGDLTLVGGGDPLLASADYASRFERQPQTFTDLDQLAAGLQLAGVRRVEGSVVGDEARYDTVRYVPSWPARYIEQDQSGPLSALTVNDGFESYPTANRPQALVAAADPPRNAAAVLTRLLEARGVTVAGAPRSGRAPADGRELAAVESSPIGDIVREMLQESDNMTAELLVKELGAAVGDPSTAGGLAEVRSAASAPGADPAALAVADGSGLSLDDRVTCDLLVDLLLQHSSGPALVERLAVAGRSGTLADRFVGTPLDGALRAKTGSLNTVTALAGVVADDDPPLTFAYLVNVPEGERVPDAVESTQRSLGEILLSWPRVPDAGSLAPRPVKSR